MPNTVSFCGPPDGRTTRPTGGLKVWVWFSAMRACVECMSSSVSVCAARLPSGMRVRAERWHSAVRVRAVRLFSSIYALAVHLCSAVRMHTTRSFSFEIAAAIVAFFITAARPGGDG